MQEAALGTWQTQTKEPVEYAGDQEQPLGRHGQLIGSELTSRVAMACYQHRFVVFPHWVEQ